LAQGFPATGVLARSGLLPPTTPLRHRTPSLHSRAETRGPGSPAWGSGKSLVPDETGCISRNSGCRAVAPVRRDRMVSKSSTGRIALAAASLVLALALVPMALAGKGKPGGGGGGGGGTTTGGGSLSLVMVTDQNGNGQPNWGDSVTFKISTTATS